MYSNVKLYEIDDEKQKIYFPVVLGTVVEGDPKAHFSIATTPSCRGGLYSVLVIAPL